LKRLHFVIAESALELVPESIRGDPSIRNDGRRRGLKPEIILLDRSIHHNAMLRLKDGYRRGRPDLVHLTLLSVTSTPLHQAGMTRVYIHTFDDVVLEFGECTRPPKSYARFRNLIEKALAERPQHGLLTVRRGATSLPELLRSIGTDYVLGFSIQGGPSTLEELAGDLSVKENPAVIVGGFPRGHFIPRDIKACDRLTRIQERSLDAHVVAARVVYELEKSVLLQGRKERGRPGIPGAGQGPVPF
jgi:rRNA small subunit pseudouridine methyltransferase Nep1